MVVKIQIPDLKPFMEEKIEIHTKRSQIVSGVLRGFDQFLNLVLEKSFIQTTDYNTNIIIIRGDNVFAITKIT